MRDTAAGLASLLGISLLISGGIAWYGQGSHGDPSPADMGEALDRQGVVFIRFWGAGVCFFGGLVALTLMRRRRAGGAVAPGASAGCPECANAPLASCALCGAPYCARHGGNRWCWFCDPGDSGTSLARRPACDGCTPSAVHLRWSVALASLFMVAVTAGLIYGWTNSPR